MFLLMPTPILAFTLKAGVSYSVNTARIESFTNIKYKIDMSLYKEFLRDNDFLENKKLLLKNKLKNKYKKLVKFSDGSYSVTYKDNKNVSFFYNAKGCLICIQFNIYTINCKKRYSYDSKGNFDGVILCTKNNEQFIFDKNKKLIAHWIGKNCYNEKGELIMTRE